MTVLFLKDYRSRAWMCRYAQGQLVTIDRPEVLREVIEGGFAAPVDLSAPVADEPAPVNTDDEADGA
jgi:hypothetical protein